LKEYNYDKNPNEFIHKKEISFEKELAEKWFKLFSFAVYSLQLW